MERSVYSARFEVAPGQECWVVVQLADTGLRRVDPVSDWILHLRPGCSANSLKRWSESLALWWRWCVDTRVDPVRATAHDFAKYVTALQCVPKDRAISSNINALPGDPRLRADTTVRQRVDDVKLFYRWALMQPNLVPEASGSQIVRFKSPKAFQVRTAPRLTAEQVQALLSHDFHPRDRLVVELLYGAGLREGEGLGLQVQDMCVNNEVAQVFDCQKFAEFGPHIHVVRRMNSNRAIAKSSLERIVPMMPRVLVAYQDWQAWIYDHLPEAVESRFLLVSLSGPTKGRSWSIAGLQSMWNQHVKTIPGLERSYPHLLRHTYASELKDAGVDAFTIQRLLGHRSPASTQVYTHPRSEQLVAAVHSLASWRSHLVGV